LNLNILCLRLHRQHYNVAICYESVSIVAEIKFPIRCGMSGYTSALNLPNNLNVDHFTPFRLLNINLKFPNFILTINSNVKLSISVINIAMLAPNAPYPLLKKKT